MCILDEKSKINSKIQKNKMVHFYSRLNVMIAGQLKIIILLFHVSTLMILSNHDIIKKIMRSMLLTLASHDICKVV